MAFAGTLVLSLWGANAGTKSVFDALNIIYKETEKRGFIELTLKSLLFTLGGLGLIMVAIASVVAVPVALNLLAFLGSREPPCSRCCGGHCSMW